MTEKVLDIANVLNGHPSDERIVHYCYRLKPDGGAEPCCLNELESRSKIQGALKQALCLIARTIGDRVSTKAWLETPRAATKVAFGTLFFNILKKMANRAWSKRVRGDDQPEEAEEEYQAKQAKRRRLLFVFVHSRRIVVHCGTLGGCGLLMSSVLPQRVRINHRFRLL